jgi:hypothetical protein
MRHHKFVVWIMIIAIAGGTLPAAAAPTASTWGGVKRLYTGEAEFVLGPGVSDSQATQAMRIAVTEGKATIEGPTHVIIAARSSQGKVLAIMGQGAAGTAEAHLVTESGAYLGGATVDPDAGTIRDLVSGAVLVRDDALRTLDPASVGSTVGTIVTRVGQTICSSVITPLVTSLLSRLLGTGKTDLSTLGLLAVCALLLSLCDSLSDTHIEQVPTPDESAIGANTQR